VSEAGGMASQSLEGLTQSAAVQQSILKGNDRNVCAVKGNSIDQALIGTIA